MMDKKDSSLRLNIIFLISDPKCMLLVFKRAISKSWLAWIDKKVFTILHPKILIILKDF